MIAHAILFVVLPLVVAWFAGVTACFPPYAPMLTRNRRSRVASDTAYPEINDQPMTAEQWLAKYAPANVIPASAIRRVYTPSAKTRLEETDGKRGLGPPSAA